MIRTLLSLFCLLQHFAWLHAQPPAKLINTKSANEIVALLASDSLQGRGNYTPELQKAADFIERQFVDAGLEPYQDMIIFPFRLILNIILHRCTSCTGTGKRLT